MLLGTRDSFFWFLFPLFGVVSVGFCIALNYAVLGLVQCLTLVYSGSLNLLCRNSDSR